ncbi:PulJ/GspJ family protein [Desulfobaculum sp.]
MTSCASARADRGFTLVEMLVALAVAAALSVGVLGALRGLMRGTQTARDAQAARHAARVGLALVEDDLRSAEGVRTLLRGIEEPRAAGRQVQLPARTARTVLDLTTRAQPLEGRALEPDAVQRVRYILHPGEGRDGRATLLRQECAAGGRGAGAPWARAEVFDAVTSMDIAVEDGGAARGLRVVRVRLGLATGQGHGRVFTIAAPVREAALRPAGGGRP